MFIEIRETKKCVFLFISQIIIICVLVKPKSCIKRSVSYHLKILSWKINAASSKNIVKTWKIIA